jgi:hypothetical protein
MSFTVTSGTVTNFMVTSFTVSYGTAFSQCLAWVKLSSAFLRVPCGPWR